MKLCKALIFTFIALSVVACNNPCKDVVCNNGSCVGDGECQCESGYEGENCTISSNTKFDGIYAMTELCDSSAALPVYSVTFAPVAGTTNRIILTGIHNTATPIEASVDEDGIAFSIARQDFGNGVEIKSISGTISTDAATINLNYQLFLAGSETVLDRCSGSMQK